MNLEFWLIIAVLVALALLVLLPPLFKLTPLRTADGEQRNTSIARQQLAELKLQLQNGVLSQDQYDGQYRELQLTLLDDLEGPVAVAANSKTGRWVVPIIALGVPLISLFFYGMLGEPQALAKAELVASNQKAADNVANMVAKLIERLKQQPDDLEGWMMLGRSYVYMQQYQNAADVFAELNKRKPNDPAVMLHYADALAMARNGQMGGEPAELVFQALKFVPEDHTALWLAGMAKAEAGDFAQAISYWKKLSGLLPADNESQQQLQKMIQMAEAEQQKPQGAASSAGSVDIQVKVVMDDALKTKVEPQHTVFIYAQAISGPKMPLAIIRKQVSDLPASVVLNDSVAMQPQTHLADFKQLRIVARISKTGNAMSQPGDLLGTAQLDAVEGNPSVSITINQEVQ
ncbi:c-type cytochrome biogenesis protein CcmI [Methylomonas sp. MO1]|uniref:c-type cytochrome biogenesis protein CcmI n=1 Tax=Methylomonas sp. MO1 TaxID=3073619 RepID=UPI0028A3CF9B|nr:c-type cytochrome biogenesis protein CcmI [Methylomonas sp. MO1]MDT4292127.1 c-type cytochrome biogenesis protein CcmI [Methylomonas sp. MO1]